MRTAAISRSVRQHFYVPANVGDKILWFSLVFLLYLAM